MSFLLRPPFRGYLHYPLSLMAVHFQLLLSISPRGPYANLPIPSYSTHPPSLISGKSIGDSRSQRKRCHPTNQHIQRPTSHGIPRPWSRLFHRLTISRCAPDRHVVQHDRTMDDFSAFVFPHCWTTDRLGSWVWDLSHAGWVGLCGSGVVCHIMRISTGDSDLFFFV